MLSADRAVTVWRSVPAARLYGRRRMAVLCRRMAVLWTAVVFVLCAVNLHFFWIVEHVTASSMVDGMNNVSLDDGQITSKSEASTVDFNYSAPQSTSDVMILSTMSQTASSLSSITFPVTEKVDIFGTSMFSAVNGNPAELSSPSTHSVPASAWSTADDVEYCFVAGRYIRFYLDVWYWIDLTLWSIAPFITIIHRVCRRHFFLFSSLFPFYFSRFLIEITSLASCLLGPVHISVLGNVPFIFSNGLFLVFSPV